ncbi:MAG: deoxyribose-phosphate aldolase [Planctomycetota bacterium]
MEHTLLRPDASRADVDAALETATALGCHAICVQPYWVAFLRASPMPIVTVAGFPFGAEPKEVKAAASRRAAEDGASEVDVVINLGALRSGDERAVAADVAAVRAALAGKTLKCILETGLLASRELEAAARICVAEGADFLKTSSGYGPRGATAEDVRFLRRFGRVKASGGIATLAQAAALLEAGAERLGASRTREILAACA